MNSNLITRKIAVPIVVLILCAASVVSVAWSYNVNHTSVWSKSFENYNLSINESGSYELDGDVGFDTKIVYNTTTKKYETSYSPSTNYIYKVIDLTITDSKSNSTDTVDLSGKITTPAEGFTMAVYSSENSSVKFYQNHADAVAALTDSTKEEITSTTLSNSSSTVSALVIFGFNSSVKYSGTDLTIENVKITLSAKSSS